LAAGTLAAPALAADPPVTPEARTHFAAGVNLLRDPDGARYEEAYREFKAAYAASPSYKILGNLALCAMKLERDGEAIEAYTNYLAHGSELDASEGRQVTTDLQTLKAGVVKFTLTVDTPGATLNDVRVPVRGERVINQYGPINGSLSIGIRAGHHIMTVRLAGREDATWEFDVTAGASESKQISLQKTSSGATTPTTMVGSAQTGKDTGVVQNRPVPSSVYIGLAATGALAIGGAITGAMALGKRSDFNAQNDGQHVASAKDLSDQGKTLNLVTDVLLGGAVVAAGITGIMYFSRPTTTAASADDAVRLGTVRLKPGLGIGKSGVTFRMSGSF
jgi:hypothetical protein